MPKVIDGLQEKILNSARMRLTDANASSFSLRAIAKDCGIAVGTIYNYYPDKETLIAEVFLEDWLEVIDSVRRETGNCTCMDEGILAVYGGLRRFCDEHETFWKSHPSKEAFGSRYQKRHAMLREQIAGILEELYAKFSCEKSHTACLLTAELLIAASQYPAAEEPEIRSFIKKLG